jgi:hypothetical protein
MHVKIGQVERPLSLVMLPFANVEWMHGMIMYLHMQISNMPASVWKLIKM